MYGKSRILRTYVSGSLGLKKKHHTQDRVWLPNGSGFNSSPPKNFARKESMASRLEPSWPEVLSFDGFFMWSGDRFWWFYLEARGCFTNPPIFFSHQNPPPDTEILWSITGATVGNNDMQTAQMFEARDRRLERLEYQCFLNETEGNQSLGWI